MIDTTAPAGVISKQTAMDIALAYREVEAGTELLAKISKDLERRGDIDIRDAFGRSQHGLQLGIPSGQNSTTLYNLPWTVARPIIELHIANQKALIESLSMVAGFQAGRSND